jgi:hypothetical protein
LFHDSNPSAGVVKIFPEVQNTFRKPTHGNLTGIKN